MLLYRHMGILIVGLLPLLGFQIHTELTARSLRTKLAENQARRLVTLVSAEQQRIFEGTDQLLTALSVAPAIRGPDVTRCRGFLADVLAKQPRYLALMVIGVDGRTSCGANEFVDRSVSFVNRRYFQEALRTGGLGIGGYVIGHNSGQPSIHLARAFQDEEGKVAGVVAVALNLAWLHAQLGSLMLPPRSFSMVSDRDGILLERYPAGNGQVGKPISPQLGDLLEGSQTSIVRMNRAQTGRPILVAWSPPSANSTALGVAVGLDERTTFAAITKQNKRGLALIIVGLAAGLVLTAVARRVLIRRPFEKLLQVVDCWRDGALSARCALAEDRTEFGRLSSAFNRMAAALEAREKSLQTALTDISHRKLAEAERQLLTDRLEARVVEEVTSREAAQAVAAQSEHMLALGALAGGMAHDFNNVLQAIGGAATLIEGRPTDAVEVRRLAQRQIEMVDRGGSVTRRLLAFGRRADLHTEVLDVGIELDEMVELLSHSLGGAIDIKVTIGPQRLTVLADRRQLETTLINLAVNARDAMGDGGVLRLSADQDDFSGIDGAARPIALAPGRYVRITVADQGVGMDASTLMRALEPFFTTKLNGSGTGLGLSMAKGFAEQSHGALSIESRPAQGTSVSLWLPAATSDPCAPPPATRRREWPGHDVEQGTLLLVDDDELVREMVAQELQQAGYRVLSRPSGEAALVCLADGAAIDLLITDFWMPDMNGQQLIARVRRLVPGLPAILLTGNYEAAAADQESFVLVRKPARIGELVDQIEASLRIEQFH